MSTNSYSPCPDINIAAAFLVFTMSIWNECWMIGSHRLHYEIIVMSKVIGFCLTSIVSYQQEQRAIVYSPIHSSKRHQAVPYSLYPMPFFRWSRLAYRIHLVLYSNHNCAGVVQPQGQNGIVSYRTVFVSYRQSVSGVLPGAFRSYWSSLVTFVRIKQGFVAWDAQVLITRPSELSWLMCNCVSFRLISHTRTEVLPITV